MMTEVSKYVRNVNAVNALPDVSAADEQIRNWWIVRNHLWKFEATAHIATAIQRLIGKDIDQLPDDVLDDILINCVVHRITP
jgi:hypothetical protein